MACSITVNGDPVTWQVGALPRRPKSWFPGPIAEHVIGGVMTANQVNCVSSFISNHRVQGSLTSKDLVYVPNKFTPHWAGEDVASHLDFTLSERQMETQILAD